MKRAFILMVGLLASGCGPAAQETAAKSDAAMKGGTMSEPAPSSAAQSGLAVTAGGVTISDGWAPATPEGARVAAAYFVVKNSGPSDDVLTAVESPRAQRAEIHEMTMDGAMMTMRKAPDLSLKPGQTVTLSPGGLHLMLFDPALPYKDGELLPVTLTFKNAGKLEAKLLIRPRSLNDAPDSRSGH